MIPIRIPENGINLQGAPCSRSDGDIAGDDAQPQVMRLDLAGGVLEDIMKASRMGKDIHMSFGKSVVCPPSYCSTEIEIYCRWLTISSRRYTMAIEARNFFPLLNPPSPSSTSTRPTTKMNFASLES